MAVRKLKRREVEATSPVQVVEGEVQGSIFEAAFCEAPEDMPLVEQIRFYSERLKAVDEEGWDLERFVAYSAAIGHVRFLLEGQMSAIREEFPPPRSGIDQMVDESTGRNVARRARVMALGFNDDEATRMGF